MSPKTKPYFILAALVALIITMGCVTVANALDVDNVAEEAAQPTEEASSPPTDDVEATAPATSSDVDEDAESDDYDDCEDCDWDDFEFDEFDRPILSGAEQTQDTEHFRIHYTQEGRDAVLSDYYVNTIAETLKHVWDVEIDQFGWAAPPPDDGIGGDDRYDVYLQDILWDGTFGYVEGGSGERYRQNTQIGDNPNTDAVESRASASFMVLDNDYADMEEFAIESYTVLDIIRSTVAHEFNHAIQFGYDSEEPADWLWEATATWMQDEVYDDLNDANEELPAVFKAPDSCQITYGGEERVEDENHWYGEWIFLRYISELYGHATVRAIWEHARDLDGYEPLETALADAGATLDDTFRGFSVALLTRGFEEGVDYPTVRLEGQAAPGEDFIPNDGVGQMAADYVEVLANGITSVELNADYLQGMLVGLRGDQAKLFSMSENLAVVDASQLDHLYLVILNIDQIDNENDCEFSPYTVSVSAAGQPQEPAQTLSVPNFTPPQVEALLDPEEYWGEDWDEGSYEEVEAPAELIPSYLPEGYEFIEAYLVEAADFGEAAIWYIPGGGTATVIDFYGPGEDDYIDITASDSPYDTLDDWLDAADYEPYDGELVTINGIDALLEDWTDEYGPYSIATFIKDGQFIVVEGNISTDEMTKVVESLPMLP